jgi:hypothetical protein
MLNFKPWWQDFKTQFIFVIICLIIIIKPVIIYGILLLFVLGGVYSIYLRNKQDSNPIIFPSIDSIHEKLKRVFQESNLDGVMILDISNINDMKSTNSLKILHQQFSVKINPYFVKSIISRFSKGRMINNSHLSLLLSLNEPHQKLLTFFLKANSYLIEFFFICQKSEVQEDKLIQYQEDVQEIYHYLFPQSFLVKDKINLILHNILELDSQYVDGIIFLNVSESLGNKYYQFLKTETHAFKKKQQGQKIIERVSNKEIWHQLGISSKIYLEMIFSHASTIEIWTFYLTEQDNSKFAIVFWTEMPLEKFSSVSYHVIYQNKVREYAKTIIENLSSIKSDDLTVS